MRKEVMSGNEAAAWAARLARAEFIPAYPITPQTECIETIAQWIADGEFNTDFCSMDSEHSVMSAAIAASATGVRVYTATSSQGLELMHEVLYIAAGLRLPIVMNNMSRGLSAPITLWSDHNDFLSMRDTGWVMFHAADNQEVLDSTLMAFKIAEDRRVLLPVVVNMDGYVLSYTSEPVELPTQAVINAFLGKYDPSHAFFKPNKPLVQGPAVLTGEDYTYFRYQHHKASLNAKSITAEVCRQWKKITGREYGLVDTFKTEDADVILVTQGSISTTAKAAILEMRKRGKKVGLLRLRMIRPLPRSEIAAALKNADAVAAIDKNIAPGLGGIMYPEIKMCAPDTHISGFVLGLGGKPESIKQFEQIYERAKQDARAKKPGMWYL